MNLAQHAGRERVQLDGGDLGASAQLLGMAERKWPTPAAGLILPGLTRILPRLTALAAAGLMIVMSSATVVHLVRGEGGNAITTAVLLVLVTVVAHMRWKVQPIAARQRG